MCMDAAHVTISPNRNEVFFVAVNVFTKWMELHASPRDTSRALAAFLRYNIFQRHGCPNLTLTENEPPYAGAIFKAEYQQWGLKHFTSAAYQPRGRVW